ncbi:hypothetical protein, partial [Acidithiobacillus thiooxidans]
HQLTPIRDTTAPLHCKPYPLDLTKSLLDNLLNRKYNVQGYVSAGGNYGAGSAGSILASPGTPRAVYASITASF